MKITYIRKLFPIDQMEPGEDIDWCRCYQADDESENYLVQTDGEINTIRINGEDDYDLDKLAQTINPDPDPDDDSLEQAKACMHRCGCRSCPWAKDCGAMNDDAVAEIYKVEDDDGDVTYFAEDDDHEIEEIDPDDLFYPVKDNDKPLGWEVKMAEAFANRHFNDEEA